MQALLSFNQVLKYLCDNIVYFVRILMMVSVSEKCEMKEASSFSSFRSSEGERNRVNNYAA